jgi:hypothetical protein
MEQVVMLNKSQLIQLAGLAAGSDDTFVIVKQKVPEQREMWMFSVLQVDRTISGEIEKRVMTATGIHEKV